MKRSSRPCPVYDNHFGEGTGSGSCYNDNSGHGNGAVGNGFDDCTGVGDFHNVTGGYDREDIPILYATAALGDGDGAGHGLGCGHELGWGQA